MGLVLGVNSIFVEEISFSDVLENFSHQTVQAAGAAATASAVTDDRMKELPINKERLEILGCLRPNPSKDAATR